jgi:ATP-binding cassette, subfamily G (WHITE), member 2, SNQ2
MLEVIGAGATATSEIDWYNDVWMQSPEYKALQDEIDRLHVDGRARPVVATKLSEYSAPWIQQVTKLLVRDLRAHWRDPSYLSAKLALNIICGLYVGFTFYQAKGSIQGTQNRMMTIYTFIVVSFPVSTQIVVPLIDMRKIFEIREQRSRMYSWTAFVTSQILAEYPYNIIGSTLNFFCWYWTVGFQSSHAGYVYLVLGVIFPLYYGTFIHGVASLAPDANVAGIFFGILMTFVLM